MKTICILLLFTLKNVYSNGSGLKFAKRFPASIEEEVIQTIDFPDVEYPQSVLEPTHFFFKSNGVLDPFTEDVKSSFKSIVETSKKQIDNIESKNTTTKEEQNTAAEDISHVVIEQSSLNHLNQSNNATDEVGEIETFVDEDVHSVEENNNQQSVNHTSNSNSSESLTSIESYDGQIENPLLLNETESLDREKRSTDSSASIEDNINDDSENNTLTLDYSSSTAFSSAEAVLPKPLEASNSSKSILEEKLKSSSESISVEKQRSTENSLKEDDLFVAPVCEENCVVDKTNSTEEVKDL